MWWLSMLASQIIVHRSCPRCFLKVNLAFQLVQLCSWRLRHIFMGLRGSLSKILRLISDEKIDFALTLLIDDTWWPSNENRILFEEQVLFRKVWPAMTLTLKCRLWHFSNVKIRESARHVAFQKAMPKRNENDRSIKLLFLFLEIVNVFPLMG